MFLKGPAYNTGSETNVGIVSARDPAVHREIRKSLSHAFSAKALRLQEEVVIQYMDLFVSQLHQRKDDEKGLNLSEVSQNSSICESLLTEYSGIIG